MTIHHDNIGAGRKIGRQHLAFVRGCIQMPQVEQLAVWWKTYLYIEGEYRERRAKLRLKELKTILAAAARQANKPRLARLVALDLSATMAVDVIPLEDFAAQFPEGFYSDNELLELWQEAAGPEAQKLAKRGKLIGEQLAAVNALEKIVATVPRAADPVDAWLESRIATRLIAGGVATLADVVNRMNGKGVTWWSGIRSVGRVAGARIQQWIRENETSIGMTLTPQAGQRRGDIDAVAVQAALPKVTAIVPLERFVIPSALDGSQGRFRAPKELCLLKANNDFEAIRAWLTSKRPAIVDLFNADKESHTQRAYRKEAERFLLWAIVQKQKPLSSMTLEDCIEYRNFLADPQPADKWCGQRGRARWGPLWRPFNGPLSPVAERQAIIILRTLYEWLMRQCYLVGNPWVGVMPRQAVANKVQIGRSFTLKQWQYLKEYLAVLPETGANRRLRLVMNFAYATGLRLSEIINARVRDLEKIEFDEGETGWMLTVIGKGGKPREVPVPSEVIEEISVYLHQRNLNPDPEMHHDKATFLIGKVDDGGPSELVYAAEEGITAATLSEQLKRFFQNAAKGLVKSDKKSAARLASASTHWLRHSHGSHAVASGTPIEIVQNNLGHASLSTTTIYVTSETKRRHLEMQKFWNQRK